jgi:hypothetical protein
MTMETGRNNGMRDWAALGIACAVLAFSAGTAGAAEEAAADSGSAVPAGLSYGVEVTSSFHHVTDAYFGADLGVTDDPAKRSFSWREGFTRLRLNYGAPDGVWLSVGGVYMTTSGTDYYGTRDAGDAQLDQFLVGLSPPGGQGLSLVAGRQDLQIGDGFLIGDGYRESKAALWSIPVNFYDALRADWQQGNWHALAFGARLSPSYGDMGDYPEDLQGGGEVGWSGSETRSLAFGYFQRADDGPRQLDARAFSLRGAWSRGPLSLAGEWVVEGGQNGDAQLQGSGGHLGVTYQPGLRGEPYVQLEYFHFSGDDPATSDVDEGFYPWNYRWTDWSRYYVADLMASTFTVNNDTRIWKLECGVTPIENTSLRLLLHRIDLDTGTSQWEGGLPEGVGRGFADEVDLVVDQGLGKSWSGWVMGSYARPREAAKALVGAEKNSSQMFAGLTFKFDGPGGSGD